MTISEENIQKYLEKLIDFSFEKAPQLILAIITLFVGIKIINWLLKILRKTMDKANLDKSLKPFLEALTKWVLRLLLLISVASMLGIETTSFVAMIGAAGLAVGLALQGALGNFAGGVLILVLKPFKIGDFVELQGYLGTVKEINIFTTTLTTPQNRKVIIPNGPISNGSLTNYSSMEKARVDLVVGVSYDSDIKQTKELLMHILKNDSRVLEDPAPLVVVAELADSSVNFNVRPWVKTEDYWAVYFDVLENVKIELDKAGIEIPFPQRDVHIKQPQ
jgi:small conductance mechanosensitive channel